MLSHQQYGQGKIKLGFKRKLDILKPYVKNRFVEQVKSVWVIIVYLILFQLLVLGIPIVYSLTIALGLFIVIIGLMFFMEGLLLGLMPLGEILGTKLPVKLKLPAILFFAALLGMLTTFAEPAIAVLKAAGSSIKPHEAPLLYSLLNEFSGQIVFAVALGVGLAVLCGVLRFIYGWGLKYYIIPLVIILSIITIWAHLSDVMNPIIGLAWDCGGVTTGPVTVPLVLALGIGVSRVVSKGGDNNGAGFGIVTLASLFPIITVFILGAYHLYAQDFYGAPNSKVAVINEMPSEKNIENVHHYGSFTKTEFEEFKTTGEIKKSHVVSYESDSMYLSDGKIIISNPVVIYNKEENDVIAQGGVKSWWSDIDAAKIIIDSFVGALQAILLLVFFLFIMLKLVLKEKIPYADEIILGIGIAILGMAVFSIGIALGLTPLGSQLGNNIPSAFARVQLWNLDDFYGPKFGLVGGKIAAMAFAFFLGYGATLAEPALNALGVTVEKITVGAFKKSMLMQTVAIGVGLGIAFGVLKITFDVPLTYILIPLYLLLIPLTIISSESFVNFAWDSAGVTTGPITVPLVLAMGLGIGANVPGIKEGFGILAMASVMPIIAVLTVGLMTSKKRPQ
ncbi:MAG: DUF1538 domain-containing protein [Chitinophagaceae bacterium]